VDQEEPPRVALFGHRSSLDTLMVQLQWLKEQLNHSTTKGRSHEMGHA
jgi:hypothetical protein